MGQEHTLEFCALCLFLQNELLCLQEAQPGRNVYLCDKCQDIYQKYCANTDLPSEQVRQLLNEDDCDLCAMRDYQKYTNNNLKTLKCATCVKT